MIQAVLVALALVAPAAGGVGIDPGAIRLDEPIVPGGDTVVVDLEVRNPGDQTSSYTMSAQPGDSDLALNTEWFRFSPDEFELEPGSTQVVSVFFELDGSPAAGVYTALFTAAIDTAATPDAVAQVTGAVATEVSFVIADPRPTAAGLNDQGLLAGGDDGGIPTWAWLVAAITVLVAALAVVTAVRDNRRPDEAVQP